MLYTLTVEAVQNNAPATPGIYEFRLKGKEIEYPNGKTPIIYLGSTKNIKKRLRDHIGKNSKNGRIRDFLKNHECSFRYVELSTLQPQKNMNLKLAEVATRKEKTFSENITANIPDSLLVLDKDLRIKRANRSFYKVFGKEHEEVIGARITDILGDEDGRLSSELTRLLGTEDNIEYFELHYPSEKLGERIFSPH